MMHKRWRSVAVLTAGVGILALTGCGAEPGGHAITFVGWGGAGQDAIEEAWLTPFSESEGIAVTSDSPVSYAKIQQMVEANQVTWDVAEVAADIGLNESTILEEIDCSIVACDELDRTGFGAKKYGVPLMVYSIVLGYNTESFPNDPPSTWSDFFDTEEFPGKRAVQTGNLGALNGLFEVALLEDGVAAEDLYPLDVERALAKLDTIRSDLIFYETNQQCVELLRDGEADMGMCLNGRIAAFRDEGATIDIAWSGQIMFADYAVVPKGTENKDAAMQLIAWMVSKEHNADLSEFIAYGPANPLADGDVSENFSADLSTSNILEGADAPIVPDMDWWEGHAEELTERWTEWLTAS